MKKQEKYALIVSGGQVDRSQLRQQIQQLRRLGGLLIAADSGLTAIKGLEIPDIAVGDFDSVDPEILAFFQQFESIRFERHRAEKDETDTELALSIAEEADATHVTFMGVTGTRLDHTLSNVHLLKACMDRGIRGRILDAHNRIRLAAGRMEFPDREFSLMECDPKEDRYPFVSFIPLTTKVNGITLTGFKYPLQDRDLTMGCDCGLCISNELASETAVLDFTDGLLLVIEARD